MQDPVVGRIFLGATQLNKALDTLDEAAEMHPLWWGRAGQGRAVPAEEKPRATPAGVSPCNCGLSRVQPEKSSQWNGDAVDRVEPC